MANHQPEPLPALHGKDRTVQQPWPKRQGLTTAADAALAMLQRAPPPLRHGEKATHRACTINFNMSSKQQLTCPSLGIRRQQRMLLHTSVP